MNEVKEDPIATMKAKLHPRRYPGMSPKMAAIVGAILGEKYTTPALVELVITSDGFLLGREEGDIGYNEMLGSKTDLYRNWANLLDVAGLTDEERMEAIGLFNQVRVF